MTEETEEVFPVRYVVIECGVNEDGGGIKIEIRADDVEIEKLVELTLSLYRELADYRPQEKRREVIYG